MSTLEKATSTSYDDVPYESLALPQTHPARLGALGRLFGLRAAATTSSRVLEIGCASGENVLSMAVTMPEARFLGIDLSRVQIERGRKLIEKLAVPNVALEQMDLMDADASLGKFDYIVAHGVFSWVPFAAQEKLFELCRELLSAAGIAYISYNTLPGWHSRRIVRDAMRYHALQFSDPQTQVAQARAILEFLARESTVPNRAFEVELGLLAEQPDSYVLHEHLEQDNTPVYFHEFVERANRHGLQYLAEAEFGSMLPDGFAPHVRETLRNIGSDFVRQEQLMDFLRNRLLRQTLLVNADVSLSRRIPPDRMEGLWISGAVRRVPDPEQHASAVSYAGLSGVSVTSANALTQNALEIVGEIFPTSITFDELLRQAAIRARPYSAQIPSPDERSVLALDLLHCFAAGAVELTTMRLPLVKTPGSRPATSPLARAQASAGHPVSTLRHEAMRLAPELAELLVLLDGTRDADSLLRGAPGLGSRDNLDRALKQLGASALLVA
jgi:SAM-dependent methyltransferase